MKLNLPLPKTTKGRVFLVIGVITIIDISGFALIVHAVHDKFNGSFPGTSISLKEILSVGFDEKKTKHLGKGEVQIFLAEKYRAERNYRAAHEAFVKAVDEFIEVFGSDSAVTSMLMHEQGDFESENKKYEIAEKVYRRALIGLKKEDGNDLLVWDTETSLSRVLMWQRKYAKAIEVQLDLVRLTKSMEAAQHSTTQSHYLSALESLASAFHSANRNDKSAETCEEALAVARRLQDKQYCLFTLDWAARVYESANNYSKSLQLREESVNIARGLPDHKELLVEKLNDLGDAKEHQSDYRSAIKLYTEAISIDPKKLRSFFNRSDAYISSKEYDLAINDLSYVIENESNPDTVAWTQVARAETYVKIGQRRNAVADLKAALPNPQLRHSSALWRIIKAYENLGMFDEAITQYDIVLDACKYPDGYIERGDLYRKSKRPALAISDYTSALAFTKEMTLPGHEEHDEQKELPGTTVGAMVHEKRAKAYLAMGKPNLAAADQLVANKLNATKSAEAKLQSKDPHDSP